MVVGIKLYPQNEQSLFVFGESERWQSRGPKQWGHGIKLYPQTEQSLSSESQTTGRAEVPSSGSMELSYTPQTEQSLFVFGEAGH